MKRRIAILFLLAAMTLSLFSGCGKGKSVPDVAAPGQIGALAANLTLSPEKTSLTTKDGVTVDMGSFVLDGEAELSVAKQPVETHMADGYQISAYDIAVGELHELDDFITIRLPYSADFCGAGQDPARCVGAKYKNDATGAWEDVLFEVDSAAQEVVIYTDHLSTYGVFEVENEKKRSAIITDVYASAYMSKAETLAFANAIAADDPTCTEQLCKFGAGALNTIFDYSDQLDNAIAMATAGLDEMPEWLDASIGNTNQTYFSALGYMATAYNLMRITISDTFGGGADKGDVLNLLRDVSSKMTTLGMDALSATGGAMALGMGSVLVIDKMLTAFAEEAHATKMEDISYVYHHYNEAFTGFGHTPRGAKEWRKAVIQVLDKYPNDPEIAVNALEAGFNAYASEFFRLTNEQMHEVASDTPTVTMKRIPNFTEDEKNALIEEYIAHLKQDVMPAVLKSVEWYMLRKAEQQYLNQLNAINIKDYYNTKITIRMKEELAPGESSRYAGYRFRFAPLNDSVDKGSWTGRWPERGYGSNSATLLGFLLAGYPHTVEFYPPDADIDTAQPEFVSEFVIRMPEIHIEIGVKAPTFDELIGRYADGTMTVTEVFISDALRAEMGSGAAEDNEYGCDLATIAATLE